MDQGEAGGRAGGLMAPQRRALTVGLVLTVTFVASEALAVVTVMPVVARDLGGLRLYGWVFSGFMLGNVIGIVAAGREADRRGPAVPFVAGVVLFGAGLALAGLAPSMGVLVAGRVLQGVGAGAVPSVAYAAIGRSLPETLRPRMMAVLSTAWVAPGLVGPAVSAEVARLFGWRWVFLGLLPIVTAVRHRTPVVASIAVTGATVAWTAGAWIQARLSQSWEGRRLVRTGLVIVLAGIAGMILVLLPGVPVAEGLAAWSVAGLGIGLAYAPISLVMLQKAPPGHEGQASASLNLADVLGTAIGIGVGGAAVAATAARDLRLGIMAAFCAAAAVGLVALAVTRRLPSGPISAPPSPAQPDTAQPDTAQPDRAGLRPRGSS